MNYLFEIEEELYRTDIKQSAYVNGKRMASALTIICCFFKIVTKMDAIPFEHAAALLSMLRLMPDALNQVCVDWELLTELLPGTMKTMAFDAAHGFAVHLSHHKHFNRPEWLYALPVIHFLNGKSEPFQKIEYRPRAIPWGDRIIGLGYVKNFIKDKEIQ